jgi:hypothetical protein
MNADHKIGWAAIKSAEKEFRNWAASNQIPLSRVEHVATFESWDKKTEIYIFFPADSDVQRFRSERKLSEIEHHYHQFLSNADYPFDRWPVTFYFDSHENVVKNYDGNYFYRLR